jgi:hypothetical protein
MQIEQRGHTNVQHFEDLAKFPPQQQLLMALFKD